MDLLVDIDDAGDDFTFDWCSVNQHANIDISNACTEHVDEELNYYPFQYYDIGDEDNNHVNGCNQTTQYLPMQLTFEEICALQFNTLQDAEQFYVQYALHMGFSVRRSILRNDNVTHTPKYRIMLCSRQGYRDDKSVKREYQIRNPRPLTRVGCTASITFVYDKAEAIWRVSKFVQEHTHELVKPHAAHLLRCHRRVTSPSRVQIDAMRAVGLKTSQIYDFLAHQAGGYSEVGFTHKDLSNNIEARRRATTVDGDVECVMAYYNAKLEYDPLFFYKYTVDGEGRLASVFWSDSYCRMDYACFGDVLVFDATYRTNIYKKPLVILVGANHHRRTTFFACALLTDETIESYMWLLNTFLEAMDNKKPISVITDGCKSMIRAVETLIPEARHRLCQWHLNKNARENVRINGFGERFNACMVASCSVELFEKKWEDMLNDFDVKDNEWVTDLYMRKNKWAEAYLRDHFFGYMKTTQRCESINAYLNKFVHIRMHLHEFVREFDRALRRLRQIELEDDVKSMQTSPVLVTHLSRLEKHAADVYTKEMYQKVKAEIVEETKYWVTQKLDNDDHSIYYLAKYVQPDARWIVMYYPHEARMTCSCKKFESTWIICCHMVTIMKFEHLRYIPQCLIVKRWTQTAKSSFDMQESVQLPKDLVRTARYGMLSQMGTELFTYGSLSAEATNELKSEMTRLTTRMKELTITNYVLPNPTMADASYVLSSEKVRDPPIIRGQGMVKLKAKKKSSMPRRCGKCGCFGHTRRSCPKQICKELTSKFIAEED